MSRVSPVYHIGSPLATTTVASLPISRTMFDRLSKRSCPLTASTTHLFPLRIGHAHAVALDQPPAFVGDRVGGLPRVEAGVDLAGELLQLRPEDLAVGETAAAGGS